MKHLALLSLLIGVSFAQESSIRHITIDDGLSQNFIYSILQDRKGFLWFGTKDGLNRYDGYSFRIFRKDNADPTSVADNTITALHQGEGDVLYIGTAAGGVQLFDQRKIAFRTVAHSLPGIPALKDVQIICISSTRDGRILIGTQGAGLFVYDPAGSEWNVYRHDSTRTNSLASNTVADVAEDEDGTIWVAAGGLHTIDRRGTVKRIDRGQDPSDRPGIDRISSLFADERGRMWVSFRTGVDLYEKGNCRRVITANDSDQSYWFGKVRRAADGSYWTTSIHHLHRIDPVTLQSAAVAALPEERISGGFLVDRSDNVWIGTGGWGIARYDPRAVRFGRHQGNFLSDLFADTYRIIDRSAGKNRTFSVFDPGLRGNEFRIPVRTRNGDLFISTSDAFFFRIANDARRTVSMHRLVPEETPDRKSFAPTTCFQDSTGTVWIVRNNGIVRFQEKDRLYEFLPLYPDSITSPNSSGYSDITAVIVTRDGLAWFGTPTNGLLRLDLATGAKRWYRYREHDSTSLSHNHVLCITEDPNEPDRFLWIGTDGGGLVRFDRHSETFSVVNEHSGLPNNTVYGILTDRHKNFWISTNKGLVHFDPAQRSMRSFDVFAGLQSNEFNRKEFYRLPDGRLCFGGVAGYNLFDPDRIVLNTVPPEVVITDLRLFNRSVAFKKDSLILAEPVEFAEKVQFEHAQNVVTFEFAAMDFTASEKNQFQYQLEGFDQQWISGGTTRTATYTNIDPGTYRFVVKAANGDGVWNEHGASVTVIIRPPFWRTWWFLTIVSLAFLSIGPVIYYVRVTGLKKEQQRQREVSTMLIESQEAERKRIAQEMHDSLGQELLVIKNRALMGLKTVQDDSKEQRQLLQISEGATNILKLVRSLSHNLRPPELDRLGLSETIRSMLTTVRDASPITVAAEVDEIDGMIPKVNEINLIRILQESLSNIEKHSSATRIEVLIRSAEQKIVVEIRDNGKGYSPESVTHGIGLAGISERVRILEGSLSITSSPGAGTELIITIPVQQPHV